MIVHARNVTEKLGKLLVASKLLDSPWNGTDFQEVLRFQAGQLLLSLRTLVSSGYLLEIEPFLVDASPPSALLAKFIGDEMVLLFSYWLKEITDIVAFIGKSASEKGAPETMVTRKILLAGMHCGRLTYTAEILNEILRLTKDTRLKFLGLKSKLSDLTVGLMRIYDALKSHFDLAAVFEYSIALMDTTGEIVNIFKEDISWCRGLGDSFLRDDIPSLANEFTLSQDLLYRSYQEEFGLVALPQQGQVKKVMEALISLDSSKHEILIFTGYESKATTNSDPKSKKKLQTDEKKLPTAPNSDTLLRSSTRFVLLESTEDTVLKAFLLSFHEMGSSIQLLSEIKQITQKASRDKQLLERYVYFPFCILNLKKQDRSLALPLARFFLDQRPRRSVRRCLLRASDRRSRIEYRYDREATL